MNNILIRTQISANEIHWMFSSEFLQRSLTATRRGHQTKARWEEENATTKTFMAFRASHYLRNGTASPVPATAVRKVTQWYCKSSTSNSSSQGYAMVLQVQYRQQQFTRLCYGTASPVPATAVSKVTLWYCKSSTGNSSSQGYAMVLQVQYWQQQFARCRETVCGFSLSALMNERAHNLFLMLKMRFICCKLVGLARRRKFNVIPQIYFHPLTIVFILGIVILHLHG